MGGAEGLGAKMSEFASRRRSINGVGLKGVRARIRRRGRRGRDEVEVKGIVARLLSTGDKGSTRMWEVSISGS